MVAASPATAIHRGAPSTAAVAKRDYHARLTRQRDGSWLLDYRFSRAAPVWFFVRSAPTRQGQSWRLASWRVETPGVRLERHGRYDSLVGAGPIDRVRIRITPFAQSLRADYSPFLLFSEGGAAVYDGHYEIYPLQSAEAAAALPDDLNGVPLDAGGRIEIAAPGGRVLYRGVAHRGRFRRDLGGESGYAYVGRTPVIETPALAGIFDPGLPPWIRAELDTFTPRLFALYRARLGPSIAARPMALVSWGGAKRPGTSLGGSVLEAMVVLQIEGAQTVAATPAVLQRVRWFLGHESAHFWMGQTVRYARRADAWIDEGSADVMAVRALERLVPGYDARDAFQREVDDCIRENGPGMALSGASARGNTRANYACGAVLLLAAEGAVRKREAGADAFTWLRGLIDANRADGKVTQADWLAAFDAATGDPALGARVRSYLDSGVADPAAFVAELFAATGVAFSRDSGRIVLR
ncbi:M1 aminopeptidase family protein [Sphingomonas hengshuiensis]|nr:hypothetical protein [Sphingomonas hengshuiensis]